MNSSLFFENILQRMRFSKALPFAAGDILDFGGNQGELQKYILSYKTYRCINDISEIKIDGVYDTIFMLAVIEHIELDQVNKILKILKTHLRTDGKIIITTPSSILQRPLELLAKMGFLDYANIAEHKHYWNRDDFRDQAVSCDFNFEYSRFQFGLNQMVIFTNK
jgi:hypothetical protein